MRIGSTPCSSNSRYTSTSFRVLPVPALAQTTVFLSKLMFHTSDTICGTRNRYMIVCPLDRAPVFPRAPFASGHQSVAALLLTRPYRSSGQRPDYLENEAVNSGLRSRRLPERQARVRRDRHKREFE